MNLNFRVISRIMGALFLIAGCSMILPLLVGLFYGESNSVKAFLYVIVPTLAIGAIIFWKFKEGKSILKLKDAFVIVTISWLIYSVIAAFPYFISNEIPSYIDAFFEASSGLSTTGASILDDVETLPRSFLFWRSFTQWIGGMGILIFAIALLPSLGIGGQAIAKLEAPGPALSKTTLRTKDTAKALYLIYLAFTVIQTCLLLVGGLGFFDAVVCSFSTVSTGGFSAYNDSIAAFHSPYIEWVVMIFMFASGVNFNLYFVALSKNIKVFWQSAEFRLYLLIALVVSAVVTIQLILLSVYTDILGGVRTAFFQVISILTTTGFTTADFSLWPTFSMMIILLLFFIGGSSASASGGVKVVRILVLLKLIKRNIALKIHPNAMMTIKLDNRQLSGDAPQGIISFVFIYIIWLFFMTFLLSLDNLDAVTNFSAVASCLGNIGPGFGDIGPSFNYNIFSDISKVGLSLTMIAGRLEIFTFLMLFTRKFWNSGH